MIILEATPDLRTDIREFDGGAQRITYELTKVFEAESDFRWPNQ